MSGEVRTVIGVGTTTAEPTCEALHFDGISATMHRLQLRMDDTEKALRAAGGIRWPYADLRALPDQASDGQLILRLAGDPVQRLLVRDPVAIRLVSARAPDLDRRPPVPGLWRLWAWGAAAVASVALIIFILVPVIADQLAGYLPPEGERALGEATLDQIRGALDETGLAPLRICETPDGQAALEGLATRLTAKADLPTTLTVHVLDSDLVNAFALPGGIVVFFDGLIQTSETPEEVAAVLAHEIGHVAARDPTRIALRSAGSIGVLGLLLGDFAGGAAVLFLAERVIQADYTQGAEAAADRFAHEMLLAADLPPSAIARLFERLQDDGAEPPDIVRHFLSHPDLGDRIAAADRAAPDDAVFTAALGEDAWRALQRICD